MATLPNVPTNTALTIGTVAVIGLVAYTQTLRTKIESQIHDNYRHAKVVDADLQAGTRPVNIRSGKADQTA